MAEGSNQPLTPIFDGHNDTLLSLQRTGRNFYERSDVGHIDRVRAKEGGLVGGFFAIFTPGPNGPAMRERTADAERVDYRTLLAPSLDGIELADENGSPSLHYAQQYSFEAIKRLFDLEAGIGAPTSGDDGESGLPRDPLNLVLTAEDLEDNIEHGAFSAILHFEGAEAIDTNFYALETFHAAGLRSLGIVWSRSNAFGHGVPFAFPSSPDTGPGLTDAGKELVRACNRLGVLIDLSHLNEKGFWDVAKLSDAPLVATHSNAHEVSPSSRNLTDKQLDAIRDSDGIVGLNFNVPFLRPDGEREPDMPLTVMADHVDYLVERIGLDRVAMGSDFDGAMMPKELADASMLPNLTAVLRERGYDDDALRKLGYRNWLRVLQQTWGG